VDSSAFYCGFPLLDKPNLSPRLWTHTTLELRYLQAEFEADVVDAFYCGFQLLCRVVDAFYCGFPLLDKPNLKPRLWTHTTLELCYLQAEFEADAVHCGFPLLYKPNLKPRL
jgi:hypothetical protein